MLLDPRPVSRSEVTNLKRHIASWQAIAMPSLGEAAPTLAMLGALVIGLFAYKLDRLAYFLSAGGPLAGDRHFWFDNPVSQFPDRLHVCAFSLLTVAVLASPHRLVKVNVRSRLSLPSCKDTRLASKDCHVPPLIHYHVTNNAGQRRPFDPSR